VKIWFQASAFKCNLCRYSEGADQRLNFLIDALESVSGGAVQVESSCP
jgi:hypothetical protein